MDASPRLRAAAADARTGTAHARARHADARHGPHRVRARLLAARRRDREDARSWWLGATRHQFREAEVAAVARRVEALLADGPRRRSELIAELGVTSTMWNGVGGWVNLLRVPPSGTWERRSADLYALAERWLRRSSDATPDDGLELIVRRYLGGFGPATRKDIATWAAVAPTRLAPTLERMPLRRFRDERGGQLLDVPRAPLPDPDMRAPVRFLPTWDATLLVHALTDELLPERYRPLLFDTKTPHSFPSFLIDGQVAGRGNTKAAGWWSPRSSRSRAPPDASSTTKPLASPRGSTHPSGHSGRRRRERFDLGGDPGRRTP